MATRTITPGARLKAAFCGSVVKTDAEWEELAKECDIQPLTEEVPPTDGQLWQQAWASSEDDDEMAATFLRLVRKRDGEPCAVTGKDFEAWRVDWSKNHNGRDYDFWMADRINAHRGSRPAELPKVTAEMFSRAYKHGCTWIESADYLNAELAKARKEGAS